jgi:hypothetical protein
MVGEDEVRTTDNNRDVVIEAKEEVKEEVKEARTENEKEELAEKLFRDFKKSKNKAEEYLRDIFQSQGSQISPSKIKEGEMVLKSLTKLIEAIRLGISADKISKTKGGAAILEEIAQRNAKLDSTTASLITYYLGDYLLGDKEFIDANSRNFTREAKKESRVINHIRS